MKARNNSSSAAPGDRVSDTFVNNLYSKCKQLNSEFCVSGADEKTVFNDIDNE